MKKNGFIWAILAFTLLGSCPINAASQQSSSVSQYLEKQLLEFKDAFVCARKKGFGACSPAQKTRIVATGLAVIGAIAALGYSGARGARWWQKPQEKKALVKDKTRRLEGKAGVDDEENIPRGRQRNGTPKVSNGKITRVVQ